MATVDVDEYEQLMETIRRRFHRVLSIEMIASQYPLPDEVEAHQDVNDPPPDGSNEHTSKRDWEKVVASWRHRRIHLIRQGFGRVQ